MKRRRNREEEETTNIREIIDAGLESNSEAKDRSVREVLNRLLLW